MKAYTDQEKLIEDTREVFRQGVRRPILMGPCGFGKTFVSSEITKMFKLKKPRGKVLFLCDKIALCEQTGQEFHKMGHRTAIYQRGWRGESNPDVLVASIQSIEKLPRLPEVDLIFHDECHVLRAYIKRMMQTYNNIPVIGLSATPFSRGLGAPGYYETIVPGPSTQELIDNNRLVRSEIYCPSTPDLEQIGVVGGEFNQGQLAEVTAKRVGLAVEHWLEITPGQQTMISATNIADSIAIIDKLQSLGVKAIHVDHKTSIKQMYGAGGIIEQFKNNEIQVLSSVFKLSIGIDLPNCTSLIAAGPTKSLIRHLQFWGRLSRTCKEINKEYGTYIDMVGGVESLCQNTDELPTKLDRGDKPAGESQEFNPPKREPARCKAVINKQGKLCGALKKGSRVCPECGFTPTPNSNINYINGKLVKKSDIKAAKKQSDQRQFIAEMKTEAKRRGKDTKWVIYVFRRKFKGKKLDFDIWDIKPAEVSDKTANYLHFSGIR